MQKKTELLSVLYSISTDISLSMKPDKVMDIILEKGVSILGAEIGVILLFNKQKEELFISCARGLDKKTIEQVRIKPGEKIAGQVAQSGKIIEAIDLQTKTGLIDSFITIYPIQSVLCQPIKTKDDIIGVLHISRFSNSGFPEYEKWFTGILANRVSIALENAELYHNLKESEKKIEESFYFIDSIIRSIPDVFMVIDIKGRILKVNKSMFHLIFFDEEFTPGDMENRIIGKKITDFLPIGDLFRNKHTGLFRITEPISHFELCYNSINGKEIWLSLSAAPVFDGTKDIISTIILLRDISVRKEIEKNLKYLTSHDVLTNLPNRVLLNDRIQQAITRAHRYRYYVGILLLDLDHFQEINDTLGHDAGDSLLIKIADRINHCIREFDTNARMGGDEFVVVLCDLNDLKEIEIISKRIISILKKPIIIKDREISITASIGVSIYPDNGKSVEVLLKNADIAMYSAKNNGGNKFSFFTRDTGRATEERVLLKHELINAIKNNEFTLMYQPLVETLTGKIIAAEALLRWQHPRKGIIGPIHFLPVAETTRLILPIGEWVLETACKQGKSWEDKIQQPFSIAVNLSVFQLYEKDLAIKVMKILNKNGFPPKDLILEITESSALHHMEDSIKILKELNKSGIQIFLDDFGSGYSSFNWLKLLPIQGLKIDRFFIQNIVDNPSDSAIVKAIIAMAHSLQIKVVAEGVETSEQLDLLKSIKWQINETFQCDQLQGYLFSKPLPAQEFTRLLDNLNKGVN